MNIMTVTVLGCGSSKRVSAEDVSRHNSTPYDALNERTRTSIHIAYGNTSIQIDCGPDYLEQIHREQLAEQPPTALLVTHAHRDHIGGFYDLSRKLMARSVSNRNAEPLTVFADCASLLAVRRTLKVLGDESYDDRIEQLYEGDTLALSDAEDAGSELVAQQLQPFHIDARSNLKDRATFKVGELSVTPIRQVHRNVTSWGFVIAAPDGATMAYSTDVGHFDAETLEYLKSRNIDHWVVDCGRHDPDDYRGHSHWTQTAEWIRQVEPKSAALIHMSKRQDRNTMISMIAADGLSGIVAPTFDGACYTVKKGQTSEAQPPKFNPRTSGNKAAVAGS